MVPIWVFVPVALWAVVSTWFWLKGAPLPIPDRGHRVFAVVNENAAKTLAAILWENGLKEAFTFDFGPTHQTVLRDNATVIMVNDEPGELPPNGLSVPAADPRVAASDAAFILRGAGFTAVVHTDFVPPDGDGLISFVAVESDAFKGWILAFRRHALRMGPPPNRRKLLS